MTSVEVLPLHKHKNLTDACGDILNDFWPRSKAARDHSLSQSTDKLPVSLAFVRKNENGIIEVLGFSKAAAVQGVCNACLVESVIVRKEDRGKGLGRVLMDLTEDYVKKLGVKTVYLNTLDQEGFYSKLGYSRCKPVVSLGANAHRVPEAMLQRLLGTSGDSSSTTQLSCDSTATSNADDVVVKESKVDTSLQDTSLHNSQPLSSISSSPPPPPPPLLPPPPPPPPPPAMNLSSSTSTTSYGRAVVRMDPNSVTWMKKDL